jgi:hypothetical protein
VNYKPQPALAQALRTGLRVSLCVGAVSLSACAIDGGEDPTLAEIVIQDPNFDFATSRAVSLELSPTSVEAASQAVEVSDAEGRLLFRGAFSGPTTLDLKLRAGAQPMLTVRTGAGAQVTTQRVNLDTNGHASASY